MATATKSGQSLSFTYNADGLRTTKTVNGVVHTYYYSGSKLVRETYGDYVLDFFYDQNGTPFMLLQNGNIYYYITNAQGDVIRLVDINGNVAASYRYDPYGKATSALGSHANINPLRYRGYVFDHETGLYYLQSRYYDPETGRFLNADAFASTGQGLLGNNMFAYCRNNPVGRIDVTGTTDECNTDSLEDGNPFNDLGAPNYNASSGGMWTSFVRTLHYAADGLKMASGQRDLSRTEKHHIISNKPQTIPVEHQEIIDRYNYSLDHSSNLIDLQGHRGRHTNAYHNFITIAITELDAIAGGSIDVFIEGMEKIGEFLKENSWIPYGQPK